MKRKITHGMQAKYEGSDGVHRCIDVLRLDDGSTGVSFTTHWDGEGKEPMTTQLSISPEAFNVFHRMMTEFSLNLGKYRYPEDQQPEAVTET